MEAELRKCNESYFPYKSPEARVELDDAFARLEMLKLCHAVGVLTGRKVFILMNRSKRKQESRPCATLCPEPLIFLRL